jgi:hypothetical protein
MNCMLLFSSLGFSTLSLDSTSAGCLCSKNLKNKEKGYVVDTYLRCMNYFVKKLKWETYIKAHIKKNYFWYFKLHGYDLFRSMRRFSSWDLQFSKPHHSMLSNTHFKRWCEKGLCEQVREIFTWLSI